MSKTLYARSLEGVPPERWQPLEMHLREVARRAAEFADAFNSADWAWNAGWLHDLGKATNAFQRYLLRCNELDDSDYDVDDSESNHASMGAVLVEEQTRFFYSVFSQMREEISSPTVTELPATPSATPSPPAIGHDFGKIEKSPVLYRSKGLYDLLRSQRPDSA